MPVSVVRTPEEEILWERAKERAHEQYPDLEGDRLWRVVMAIYKKMAHYAPRTTRHRNDWRSKTSGENNVGSIEATRRQIP
jgi:hypothetical protein